MTEPVSSMTSSPPPSTSVFTVLVAVWASVAWAILWPVDKSCKFVYLTGQYVDVVGDGGNETTVAIPEEYFIYRGTQRGAILPQDPCEPWRTYEDDGTVQLDTYMVTVRVSTALSIVLGFFLWIYVMMVTVRSKNCCGKFEENVSIATEGDSMEEASEQQQNCSTSSFIKSCLEWTTTSRSMKIGAVFLSFCVAVFQALTHLMVHSSLCEDSEPIEVVLFDTENNDSSQTVVYDTCLHDTIAYNLTFVTMVMWVALAFMIGFFRLTVQRQGRNDDNDDDTPRQQQKDDQASGVSVDDTTNDVTSGVDPLTENNALD